MLCGLRMRVKSGDGGGRYRSHNSGVTLLSPSCQPCRLADRCSGYSEGHPEVWREEADGKGVTHYISCISRADPVMKLLLAPMSSLTDGARTSIPVRGVAACISLACKMRDVSCQRLRNVGRKSRNIPARSVKLKQKRE